MPKTTHGRVTITIGEDELELVPTLAAHREFSTQFRGLRGVMESFTDMDATRMARVIAIAADIPKKEARDLDARIFVHGVADVVEQCAPFIAALVNPTGDEEQSEGKGKTKED